MKKVIILMWLVCGLAIAAEKQPNIIVVLTDDQGYADLGSQGVVKDIRTPYLDRLAAEGVRFTSGYVTAPTCGPSRAGLLTGRYQQRMGVEDNKHLPFDLNAVPFPQRLRQAGYRTGMTGKLHLPIKGDKGEDAVRWGFDEHAMLSGNFNKLKSRLCTHDPDGKELSQKSWMEIEGYRLDVTSDFAVRFIDRNHDKPFFLYVSYLGPHTPLEATEKYLSRFPDITPPARRYGLAMISAIDDGVGRILEKLQAYGIDENTLVFFLSDNGAPLGDMRTLPIDQLSLGEWDGSLNTPMLGEKTMISEGGIRVPFLLRWKGTVLPGQVIDTPIISLDVAATSLAVCNGDVSGLDGENLIPLVTGKKNNLKDRALYWMVAGQLAVRCGDWKLLQMPDYGPFLFDMKVADPERVDLISKHPEIGDTLRKKLDQWKLDMGPRGNIREKKIASEKNLFRKYFPSLTGSTPEDL